MSTNGDGIPIGVIGRGYGQGVMVPAFRQDPRCRVVAIAASTRERADEVALRLDIPNAHGDWRDLINDDQIRGVGIAVPPGLQPEIAIEAMRQGKAVLCEKPLALDMEPAVQMAATAAQFGAPNIVDYVFPEIPEWRAAKKHLEAGAIGDIHYCSVQWHIQTYSNRQRLQGWKTQLEMGGGTLFNFASHSLYYLEWLVGPLCSMQTRLFRAKDDARSGDTFVTMALEFVSGASASLSVNADAHLGCGHRIELFGSKGTLVLNNPKTDHVHGFELLIGGIARHQLECIEISDSWPCGTDGRIDTCACLVSRLLDWMQKGVPGEPSLEQGLRGQRLLAAAVKSAKEGILVDVAPD